MIQRELTRTSTGLTLESQTILFREIVLTGGWE